MFTKENAKQNQLLAAKSRKENNAGSKAFKEFFNSLLNETGGTINGREATKKELVTARAVRILLDEDTTDKDFLKAFEVIRDTIGEKPIDRLQVSEIDQSIIDEMEMLMDVAEEEPAYYDREAETSVQSSSK